MSYLCGDSRLIRRHGLLLALVLSLTTACTALPIAIPPEQNTFLGIALLLSDVSTPEFGPSAATGPLRILVIHGMGTPGPYDFEAFIAALANRLRLAQIIPPPAVTDQAVGCPPPEILRHRGSFIRRRSISMSMVCHRMLRRGSTLMILFPQPIQAVGAFWRSATFIGHL